MLTKFNKRKIHLAIFSACLGPLSVSATELNPIEVSDSREQSQAKSTGSAALLQTGNSETGSTLRQMSGVDAIRIGGHGGDLVVRGQKESQLNILIDGAKIEGGCPNRMDPPSAYAELSSMDEVTVIKGVNSVTYGSGGTGGTVLFERHAPTFEEGKNYNGEINLGGTNNGLSRDLNASVSAGSDMGYIVLQASKKDADNYRDGNGDEVRSSYETKQGHIDLGWTPNPNNEVRLSIENSLTEDALFQGAGMDSPESDGTTTRLRYKGKNLTDHIQAAEIDLYHSKVDHLMDNYSLRTPGAMLRYNETDVTTTGQKFAFKSEVDNTSIHYGVQLERIGKDAAFTNGANDLSIWLMWPGAESQTNSVFAETTSKLDDEHTLILGLRYDQFKADATDASKASDTGNTAISQYNRYQEFDGDVENTASGFNGLARLEKQLDNGMNLYAGISRTHRYPDATELYIAKGGASGGADISWIGNPDLKPEQHNQLDIGVSQSKRRSDWSVSAYYDAVNNFILRDTNPNTNQPGLLSAGLSGGATQDSRNVYSNKKAVIYGIETSIAYKLNDDIDIGTHLSFSKGRNITDKRNLSNISPVSGSAYGSYTASNWHAGIRANFAANQTTVNEEYGELETAGWSTFDLYGNYQVNKSVSISAGVDNLFDKAYENYLNRIDVTSGNTFKLSEPGRIVWAKLNASF